MNLVIHLFVTTVLGVVSCHGSPAGNFMASSPCFSFQGQNILWPAGPQGMAGISSGNPMSWFSHPFFGGGGCNGAPASKSGVAGAPTEASLAQAPPDQSPAPSAPAPVLVSPVPVTGPAPASQEVHTSVTVPEASLPVEEPVIPAAHGVSILHDPVSHHGEPLHVGSHHAVEPASHVESLVLKEPPVHVESSIHEVPSLQKGLTHEESDHDVSFHANPAHELPIDKHSHEVLTHEKIPDITTGGVEIHTVDAAKKVDLIPAASETSPKIIVHEDSASVSDSVEIPHAPHASVKIPIIHEEASLCNMPSEPLVHIPCLNSTIPSPVDSCNISCPHIPVIDPLSCHHDITHLLSTPTVDTCNFTFPPLIDACNISCHNISDLDSISCHNPWHTCNFPGVHPIYNQFPNIPYDAGFGCHGIYSNQILDHHPHIYNDHFHTHHFDGHHCCSDPGYETNILPPISYFNISDPNELNLTDIQNCLPSTSKIITNPSDLQCARHSIVTDVKPVIDECITCIPVIKNRIKQKEETFTRHIPIVTNHISTREEKRLCHIPIVNQRTRNVIEHQHDHIPVTQSHLVPIVQPYVEHVPVTRQYIRPIVEASVSHVPIVETCIKPVIHHSVSHVPITERRITPTFHQEITHVPIRDNVPEYRYCGTPQAEPLYAAHTLPAAGSIDQLNYPGIRNSYITEGPTDNYNAASNLVSSYNYADQAAEAPLINHVGTSEGRVVGRVPEFEQTFNDFRRNLFIPSASIHSQPDGIVPHQEASLPAAPEEYSNARGIDEEPYNVQESRGYDQTEGTPVGEPQDYYQGSSSVRVGEPASSPLSQVIPFPQGNAEEVTERSAGYSGHSDYCD